METENSEVHKMIHEGVEVYLNGTPLGNGEIEYEVETPYEEVRSGKWGPETLTRPAKRTFKITMPEGADSLQGDWIIKRYTPDGNIKEVTFGGQDEARSAMQAFRELGLKGHFELVCRPRSEDMVVASYRHEPEKEPLAKPLEEESGGFDREQEFDPAYIYTDGDGDEWENVGGRWITGGTHDERVGTRVGNRGYVSLPEEYGPYRKGRLGSEAAEQDAEQVLDPTYTYRDKDGDTWEFLNHNWRCTDYGRDATNYLIPPVKYGPYTRIERESSYE